MRDGAVVTLEAVLAGHLPGRVELELPTEAELARVEVEHVRQPCRHGAERVRQRRSLYVGVDKNERPPRVDREPDEEEILLLEGELTVGSRRRAECSVEAVRPPVVAALERLSPATGMGDR